MVNGAQNNAMAEIALALAMGFFSIMVLTLVSMGGGASTSQSAQIDLNETVQVRPPVERDTPSKATNAAPAERVLIYWNGRFLDAKLQYTDPSKLTGDGPLVLAVDPKLPLTEAIAVQKKVAGSETLVTTLDERWMSALKELGQ